jgi:ribosomal protein S18 acetylase RimI-like enzyme
LFTISRLPPDRADEAARLIADVISGLDYYSSEAQRLEIGKHTPDSLREAVEDDPDSVLIATATGGAIIGFCISNLDDGLIWLAWFGVDRGARGTGVGRALLDALQQTVLARGAHKTWCDCRTTNAISATLLMSVGFTLICTLTNHWYGHDFLLLERPAGV